MFKNKSKVAKFSNGLLIAIFVLALISCLSMLPQLISGNVTVIEGYTINDYWKDEILMICYVIFSGLTFDRGLSNEHLSEFSNKIHPVLENIEKMRSTLGIFDETGNIIDGIKIE